MSAFISQMTVLVIVAIIVFTILTIFGYLPKPRNRVYGKKEKENHGNEEYYAFVQEPLEQENRTTFMNFWKIRLYDESGRTKKEIELNEIPAEGLIIGTASDCSIQIKDSKYVGRHHAVIGRDEKGMFIQDMNSTNGMYDENQKRVEQLDITSGLVLYLANVQISFETVNPFNKKTCIDQNIRRKTGNITAIFPREIKKTMRR